MCLQSFALSSRSGLVRGVEEDGCKAPPVALLWYSFISRCGGMATNGDGESYQEALAAISPLLPRSGVSRYILE